MKITLIRKDEEQGTEALSLCDTDAFFEKVKTENKAGHISELREILPRLAGSSARYVHIDKLPRVYPAVEYTRKQKGEKRMKHYNGLVQLEVNRLADLYEVEYVKRQVEQLPQTFAAFCGSSGRSVKIWVRFARTDGSLPTATQEVLLFHAHAYRLAVTCYQPMLPFGITLKEPDLMQSCRMTVDEQPYYNPSSAPFCIEQPLTLPDEETFRQRKQNSESAPERMTPGCESMQIFAQMYQSARKRALAEMENWKRDDGLEPLLPHLVEQCFKTGIPEEEAVQRTLMHYFHATDTETIRTAFGNGYREMKGFGKKSGFSKEQEATFRLEEFLKRRYEFRFNTVLDEVEYRQRDSVHFYFKPLDKRTRNSIALCALKEGLQVWDRDIDRFLTSDFVPLYNPVEEYLCDLPRWDGTDRIRALARLVPCGNPHWEELFYRWFLGMVAHWRGDGPPAWKQHFTFTCRFARIPEIHLLPYLAATRTPFRLCRQPGLQQQTGSGACLGTIFPYQPGRIRPDYRKSTRLSETSATKTDSQSAQALRNQRARITPLCLIHRHQQSEGFAHRPHGKPSLYLYRSDRSH